MIASDILIRQEPAENGLGTWRAEVNPLVIQYSCAALQQIVESARKNPEQDAAGVLFGTYGKDLVRILAFRELLRENPGAPFAPLPAKDQEILLDLLKAPLTDPKLKGLCPVGWYHAQGGEIRLSPGDLAIYNRYFPVRWQIGLVLRAASDPARGGFFFREKIGPLRSESSYAEFTLEPEKPAPPPAPAKSPQPQPSNGTGLDKGVGASSPIRPYVLPEPVIPESAAPGRVTPVSPEQVNGGHSPRPAAATTPIVREKPEAKPTEPVAVPKAAVLPSAVKPAIVPQLPVRVAPAEVRPKIVEVKQESLEIKQKPAEKTPEKPSAIKPVTSEPAIRPAAKRPAPEPPTGTPIAAPVLAPGRRAEQPAPVAHDLPSLEPAPTGILTRIIQTRPLWLWISLGAILFAGILFFALHRRSAQPAIESTTTQNAGLSLRVEKENESLRVSWDREAPPMKKAVRAVLSIMDGARSEQINLGVNELQSGSVLYAPNAADVNFQLAVYASNNRSVSESVRIVTSRPSPLADLLIPKAPPKPVFAPAPPAGLAGESPAVTQPPQSSLPAPINLAPPPEPPPVKATEPPPAPQRETSVPNNVTPPVTAKVEQPPAPAVQAPPAPVQSKPMESAPVVQKAAEEQPKPQNVVPQPPPPAPARPAQQASAANFVPPRPTRKTLPDVPANIRHLMLGSLTIDVKISVDANGQVTDAVATSKNKGNKLSEYLGVRAAQAARQWKFEPAKLNGKNVAGETIVEFKF